MLGLWIDGLTPERRDGIIEHPDPTFPGFDWRAVHNGVDCGCLVGAAYRHDMWFDGVPEAVCGVEDDDAADPLGRRAGLRFPALTRRFGPERVWRACKMRAARANRVALAEPADMASR